MEYDSYQRNNFKTRHKVNLNLKSIFQTGKLRDDFVTYH